MNGTGWQQPWIKWMSLGFVLVIMGLLFVFSNQPHEVSEQSSAGLAKVVEKTGVTEDTGTASIVKKIISPIIHTDEDLPPEQQAQQIARKLGHILIFAALGFWIRIALESWFGQRKHLALWSVLGGMLYGAFDEAHQMLVPGRSSEVHDVIVDGLGVALGVWIAVMVMRFISRRLGWRRERKEA